MRNATESQKANPEGYVDHLRIFDYQLTPQTEIHLRTSAGGRLTLRQMSEDLLDVITRNGDRVYKKSLDWRGQTGLLVSDVNGESEDFLVLNGRSLIVTAASDDQFVGRFGLPFLGLRVGKGFELYGGMGMRSSPLTRMRAQGVLPDLITHRALELIDRYAHIFGNGDSITRELTKKKILVQNHPNLLFAPSAEAANDQYKDVHSIQSKVSAMIRGIIRAAEETGSLPMTAGEIMEIQGVFGRLLASQCYHPHGGMARFFNRDIWLSEGDGPKQDRYNIYSLVDLDGKAQAFSVTPQPAR